MGWWSGSGTYQQQLSPQAEEIKRQIEMMDLVFRMSVQQCGQKCVSKKYLDGEVNKGEAVCIQRCQSKFLTALELVSGQLSEMGGMQQT